MNNLFDILKNKSILVTGSSGFIGAHVLELCKTNNIRTIECPHHLYDLRLPAHCADIVSKSPDYILHLGSFNGGINFNNKYPADIFYDNTVMGLNMIKVARMFGVKKIACMVTSCAYPPHENLVENNFLADSPHTSVACHGYAKRNLQLACRFYNKQYGLNAITICPNTVIGPRDCIDLGKTKVGMAIIKRICDAQRCSKPYVTCWGTGLAKREFMYVEDVCKCILLALIHYNNSNEPINIGNGQEVTIKQFTEIVQKVVGYEGEVRWDTTKSDGQMRKKLSLEKMRLTLPTIEFTSLEESVRRTAEWYQKNADYLCENLPSDN